MFKKILEVVLALQLVPLILSAQSTITVSGVVKDVSGLEVIGASVVQMGKTVGVPTGLDGGYSIVVPADAVLEFSYVGMKTREVNVSGRSVINVILEPDTEQLEATVVVGYGVQSKGSLTGSVSAISSETLIKTKNENPQNMLTGKIAGVRVWQKSAEPGTYSSSMDIRGLGTPLIVIDGVSRSINDFNRLSPSDIENISVLKDASAAIYGVRGANGVILVTTKTGEKGTALVSYNGSFTMQFPSGLPKLCTPQQEMTLYNEMSLHSVSAPTIVYGPDAFEAFNNGSRVAQDWNSLVFSDWAPQTSHDVSVSGGNDIVQYYAGFNYDYQQSFFASGDLWYRKLNARTNLTVKPVGGLELNVSLSAYSGLQHTPWKSAVLLIRNLWQVGSLYPAYIDEEQTKLNYDVSEGYNTVAMMSSDISGHRKYEGKSLSSSASASFDFGQYIKPLNGLVLKGMISYDYERTDNEKYKKSYQMYTYNTDTASYEPKTFAESSPSYIRQEFSFSTQLLGQVTLNYGRTFAGKHKVAAMVGWEAHKGQGRNAFGYTNLAFSSPYLTATSGENVIFNADPNGLWDNAYEAILGRLNYGYDERYLLEAQFRYDGSSKFAEGHRWGFFPSFSAGWRISQEPWFQKSALSFINQLKLRASYGILGDDGGINYEWMTGYTYPSNDSAGSAHDAYYEGVVPGYLFGNRFIYGFDYMPLANEFLTWYKCHSFDVGIDFEAWHGLLGMSFDYYHRLRTGLYAYSGDTVPTIVGLSSPMENANADENLGFDFELSHNNRVGDFSYGAKLILTVTRSRVAKSIERSVWGNSYDEWFNDYNGRYTGFAWGYDKGGRYESWEDLWNAETYHGHGNLPGDYYCDDWNDDGYFDGADAHPYAIHGTPRFNYSLNLDFRWKGLDLSLLLQGAALSSMAYQEPLYSIWGGAGPYGGTLVQYWDRWHPEGTKDGILYDPYDQTLKWTKGYYGYTGSYPEPASTFNRVSTAYLRLKSFEVGYTIPKFKKFKDFSLRVFMNAYNIFTLTGVKFVDPEHPEDELGRLYPLNKTVTFGINLTL